VEPKNITPATPAPPSRGALPNRPLLCNHESGHWKEAEKIYSSAVSIRVAGGKHMSANLEMVHSVCFLAGCVEAEMLRHLNI
jgi:hypothetical protein